MGRKKRLGELLVGEGVITDEQIEEALKEQKAMQLDTRNPEFQDALNLIQYTRQSVFLTGKAGTGKSTFLKYVCANVKKKHVVLAPTGIAAIFATKDKIDEIAVHSAFDPNDIDGYGSYAPHACPLCKKGEKIDALINCYGFSKL